MVTCVGVGGLKLSQRPVDSMIHVLSGVDMVLLGIAKLWI